jgi:hypothetical protein
MDVAKEGVLREGGKPVGWVKSLSSGGGDLVSWVAIRVKIEGNEGVLVLFDPYEQDFRIEARPVRTPHRVHWYFECPGLYVREQTGRYALRSCGRLVRTLYRPNRNLNEDLFALWACRHCWRVRYLERGADGDLARAHRDLNRSLEMAVMALHMVDIGRDTIALLRQSRAARKQEAAERAQLRAEGWSFQDETPVFPRAGKT